MKKLTFILIGSSSILLADSYYDGSYYIISYQNVPSYESSWTSESSPTYQSTPSYSGGSYHQANLPQNQSNQHYFQPKSSFQDQQITQPYNQSYQTRQSYQNPTGYQSNASYQNNSSSQENPSNFQTNQPLQSRQRFQQGPQADNYNRNSNSNWRESQSSYTDMRNDADEDLAKQVHSSLSGWFSTTFENVSYDIDNGNVTLRGTVETFDDKKKAEDAVRKIQGVRRINNVIAVNKAPSSNNNASAAKTEKYPQDFAATDEDKQLNSRIRDKLSGGWFSKGYDLVVLRTNRGIVVITGQVDTNDDIRKINDKLKDIKGIRSIDIQVQPKSR